MPNDKNITLTGFNDIFKSTARKMDSERVVELPLTKLYAPEFHPFHVNDDVAMERLVKSIEQYGVLVPGIVRVRVDGGYELVCGNRRKRACELAEITTLPVIIRDMDDYSASLTMVDTNLENRENLLYSEKAWAYKIKMEALNHKGVKGDKRSSEIIEEQTGDSRNQIFRLIRLTELIVGLLDKVDRKQLAFNPAVELSYISQTEQAFVASVMEKYEIKPSLSQAMRIKKLKQAGELTSDMIEMILSETKKPAVPRKEACKYTEFFPANYTQKQMDDVIIRLLTAWKLEKIA